MLPAGVVVRRTFSSDVHLHGYASDVILLPKWFRI